MAYRGLKSNLLIDGIYTVPGEQTFSPLRSDEIKPEHFANLGVIASIFPVSVQGVSPARTEALIPELKKNVGSFFAKYRPPVFPGAINETKVTLGEKIFQQHCAGCHGQYEAFTAGKRQLPLVMYPNKLIPLAVIGTDPQRILRITPDLQQDLSATWISQMVEMSVHQGYMPPILAGLWATGPYLHNGSVPTLWHLMHPAQRPVKFYVGGHKLDFAKVGLLEEAGSDGVYRYPKNYRPWSQPVLMDTEKPAQSRTGHERPFQALSEIEKDQLLEYLKLL